MESPAEQNRYQRQMLLPWIGKVGQERLLGADVLLVGCGALGTVIAEYLVRAGVGHLRLVDRDIVEMTNLQRQTLFAEADVGVPKAMAAAERLRKINSGIVVEGLIIELHSGNAEEVISGAKLIVDGTDNASTRYLLNDVAVKLEIPWIYGGAVGMDGRVMGIVPGVGPCLRCLFPAPPGAGELGTCDTVGVLGPLAGIVGSMQAAMAIRMLAQGPASVGRDLLTIDLERHRFVTVGISEARREDCPCCGLRRFEFLDAPGDGNVSLCGRNAVQIRPNGSVDVEGILARLSLAGRVNRTPYLARCELHDPAGFGLTVFMDGRMIIQGTNDIARARSIAARFAGA